MLPISKKYKIMKLVSTWMEIEHMLSKISQKKRNRQKNIFLMS